MHEIYMFYSFIIFKYRSHWSFSDLTGTEFSEFHKSQDAHKAHWKIIAITFGC